MIFVVVSMDMRMVLINNLVGGDPIDFIENSFYIFFSDF